MVGFVVSGDGALLVKVEKCGEDSIRDFDDWALRVRGTIALGGMTTDEYMEWLRGPRDDLDPR
jgi:hypothetical protein